MTEIKYIDSTELENLILSGKKILVDFYETNCGPCKMMAMVLKDLAKTAEGIEIVALEFSQNQEAAKKYQVNNTPYLLLFAHGVEQGRLIGLQQKPVIAKLLQQQTT